MGSDLKEQHHEGERQVEQELVLGVVHEGDYEGGEVEREAVGVLRFVEEMRGEREEVMGALEVAVDEDDEMMAEIEADLIFSDEAFPSLPDFPCLSSPSGAACSSSSSSLSSSSGSSASWAIEQQHHHYHQQHAAVAPHPSSATEDALMTTTSPPSCENHTLPHTDSGSSMDLLAEMDLLGPSDDAWDPSSLFPDDKDENESKAMDGDYKPVLHADIEHRQQLQEQVLLQQQQQRQHPPYLTLEEGLQEAREGGDSTEELAMVFLEWLRSNKEAISPHFLRSIKLRRSTVECAARNLGGGRVGLKRLLKLILSWVQSHHLQKKKPHHPLLGAGEEDPGTATTYQQQQTSIPPPHSTHVPVSGPGGGDTGDTPNPSHSCMPVPADSSHGFPACSSWASPGDPTALSSFPSPMSCGGDALYSPGATAAPMQPFSPSSTIHAVEPICSWPPVMPPHYPTFPAPPGEYAMGQLFHQGPGEPLVRLAASATKEARKKRMARQRRYSSLHHHQHQQHSQHHQSSQHQQQQQLQLQQCAAGLPAEGLCPQMNGVWPPNPASTSQQVAIAGEANITAPMQQRQRQHNFPAGCPLPEKRQGWKTEKNLRFLLQKVLKQSDVGSLGRIVLPKKEAEMHLPELDTRDGISIAMEDIGTSRTWNMRYRFWPNNKSRMYLLENTGDFVRSNGLQEGDFIIIYSDVKCGKYMIRGVKVRRSTDSKADGKNSGKQSHQRNGHTGASHSNNGNTKTHGTSRCITSSNSPNEEKENPNEKKEAKGSTFGGEAGTSPFHQSGSN